MPTIATIGNLKIQVFADDHNPPHFHAVTPDREALIRIADLTMLAGSLSGRELKAVIAWAATHTKELNDEWHRLNQR
jgi:hypothetical protein